jgi:hypothetical protein
MVKFVLAMAILASAMSPISSAFARPQFCTTQCMAGMCTTTQCMLCEDGRTA